MTYKELLIKLSNMSESELEQTVQLEADDIYTDVNLYQVDMGLSGHPMEDKWVLTTQWVDED